MNICFISTHSSLFVGLLNCVTGDLRVSIVAGSGPLQSDVEAPGIHDLHAGRRPRQFWKEDTRLGSQRIASCFRCIRNLRSSFTDDLEDERRFVLKVLHLHTHLIRSGVFSLGRTDEQDAVSLRAADVDPLLVQGLSVLRPGHDRFGFALRVKEDSRVRRTFWTPETVSFDLP